MDNKKGRRQEKNVFHKTLFNVLTMYTSNLQNFKRLKKLVTVATRHCDKIELKTHAPILRITQKCAHVFKI
jgi:hypothetical protein